MPKGYWMVHVTVTNSERYPEYVAAVGDAMAAFKYQPRFLVRGGRAEAKEGAPKPRHVLVEFDSYEDALECYQSSGYQTAAKLRQQFGETDFVVVEGS